MLSLFTYGLTFGVADRPSGTKEVAKHIILFDSADERSVLNNFSSDINDRHRALRGHMAPSQRPGIDNSHPDV